MHTHALVTHHSQRGVSTLLVAIVLLIAATFLTFFAAKVGMQEQRMSGNDYRHKEAFSTAEALLDRTKTFAEANHPFSAGWAWTACAGVTAPCGDGSTQIYNGNWKWVRVRDIAVTGGTSGDNALGTLAGEGYLLSEDTAITPTTGYTTPVVLVATGRSADQTGQAIIRQAQKKVFTVKPGPVPPLMAPMVGALGSFALVGNPNHKLTEAELLAITPQNCDTMNSGSGQLLSIWTKNNFNQLINGVASWDICQKQFFGTNTGTLGTTNNACFLGTTTSGCGCQSGNDPSLTACRSQDFGNSTDANKLTDCGIKDSDPNFPADVFAWTFGASPADVKAKADQVLANCSSLGANSTGLIWVTGNCNPSAAQVGSRTAPVVLVVEGEIDFGANNQVWGLVVGHNSPKVKLGGGFTIHGAMIIDSDSTVFQAAGTYNALYDPCVFAAIYNGDNFVEFAPIAGSWSDKL